MVKIKSNIKKASVSDENVGDRVSGSWGLG